MPLETDLRARIGAAPFERSNRTFPELRVKHLLADTKARIFRALFVRERWQRRGNGFSAAITAATLLPIGPRAPVPPPARVLRAAAPARCRFRFRRKPLQRGLRQLVEKPRTNVVACLSMQHAA